MSDVLIRLAAPGEYEAIGELGVAAYSHDYDISDGYRRELDFRLLAVAPSARRRGIGRLLTEHVIALAAERGAVRVVMNSGPDMTGAHQLYYSMGFARLTERETRIVDGHTRPLLAFGYEVGDGGRL